MSDIYYTGVDCGPAVRGATVQFSAVFRDFNKNVVNPDSATLRLVFNTSTQVGTSVSIPMTPPVGPSTTWTALWDTRGVFAPQTIPWSIYTGSDDPAPVTVAEGQISLVANDANLVEF